jgi:hypothetical protein
MTVELTFYALTILSFALGFGRQLTFCSPKAGKAFLAVPMGVARSSSREESEFLVLELRSFACYCLHITGRGSGSKDSIMVMEDSTISHAASETAPSIEVSEHGAKVVPIYRLLK